MTPDGSGAAPSTTDLAAQPARRTPRATAFGALRRAGLSLSLNRAATAVLFCAILLIGAALRFTGLNWDQGQHLHPDERNLTQVLAQLQWPSSFGEYLDEAKSPLNPRNVGFSFFAYGTLPTTAIKAAAIATGQNQYDTVYLLGRGISATLDLSSLVLVFLIALRVYRDRRVALLAMFLLATSVLAIQQAHFMVVDPWASFFLLAACYFLVGVQQRGGLLNYLAVGLFFGLAMASKLSVFTFAIVVTLVGVLRVWQLWRAGATRRQLAVGAEQTFVRLVLCGAMAFLTFRLAQPDAFNGPGFLDMGLSPRWLANLDEVSRLVSGASDIPPGVQWTDRTPLLFPWLNMVIWGMGIPLGLTAWAGWLSAAWRLVRRRDFRALVPVAWVGILFLHQGSQWVTSMRYFLPIYPLLALLAAWLLIRLFDRATLAAPLPALLSRLRDRAPDVLGRLRWTPAIAIGLIVLVGAATWAWALAFAAIYSQQHTRVQATRWIYANIAPGAALAVEYWDDALPIRMDGHDPFGGEYVGVQMGWYDNDSPAKLQQALGWLDKADYVILSSNRLYDSIPRLPLRYPMAIKYYQALFNGSLGFERVAEFTAYPQLLGIPIPDQGAEEAFSVYDHPRVQIFRKTAAYSHDNTANLLGNVDWARVLPLTPKQATAAPSGLLLPTDLLKTYQDAGTWSQLFNPLSAAASSPPLAWGLMLLLLAAIAVPYLFVALRSLPDRGLSFAPVLGLLMPAVVIWLLASLRLVAFERSGILFAVLLCGAGAVFIAQSRWAEIRTFWRARRGLLLLELALFVACFVAFLLIRAANPDLWHDVRGGEKPMDLAFLTAVVKSPYFPPYDPWFADGYINYYYFGFVPVAMLIKLAGIAPDVAYNLAIPTLFALTALGAFGLALGLVSRGRVVRRRDALFALLGATFVVVCGNLAQLKVLGDGFAGLAGGAAGTSPLDYAGRVVAGIGNFVGGKALPINNDWWFWNASRVISHPATEGGPINEFPMFTFLFADLHAHALDLPFTLLALGLALAIVRGAPVGGRGEWLRLALLALATGTLWATNTWDFPTFSVIVLAALLLRHWQLAGRLDWPALRAAGWRWLAVLAGGYLIFWPFHESYGAGFGSVELWGGSRTPPNEYLLMHGLFLFLIVAAMLADLIWGHDHNAVIRSLRLRFRYRLSLSRLRHWERRLLRDGLWLDLSRRALIGVVVVALLLALVGFATAGLIVVLLTLVALLLFRRRPQPLWQLGLLFAGAGLGLTLAVEFVVLKGDISRINTVFKFYFQAWTLFALAAVLAAAQVWARRRQARRVLRAGWSVGFALLLGAALLYPLLATPARLADRMAPNTPATLDGSAFMASASYTVNNQKINLVGDQQAIEWLQSHVAGTPILAEANTYPLLYGWGSRFAMFTGLPDIVGWDFHERQQRALVGGDVVTKRIADVQRLYATPDPAEAHSLLKRYDATVLIVGALERATIPAEGIAKFAAGNGEYWEQVYDQAGVQIYRVLP